MKKIVSLIVVISIVFSCFTGLLGFNSIAKADDFVASYPLVSFEGKTQGSQMGWTEWNVGALSISKRDSIPCINVTTVGQNANPVFYLTTDGVDMSQMEYIQFHIKGPGTTSTTAPNMSLRILINEGSGNARSWEMSNSSALFETKADGADTWTANSGSRELWISKNFAGFIRIPLDKFLELNSVETPNENLNRNNITELKIWLNTWGAATTNSVLFDSFTAERTPPRAIPQGNDLMTFEDKPDLSKLATLKWSGDSTISLETISDVQSFKINATQDSVGPVFQLDTRGKKMSEYDYIEFYISGPGSNATDGSINLNLNANLYTSDGTRWLMSNDEGAMGEYYLKPDGDSEWTTISGQNIWLNKNFSGFIRLPLSKFIIKENITVSNSELNRNDITEIALWMSVGNPAENIRSYFIVSSFTAQKIPKKVAQTPVGNNLQSFVNNPPLNELGYLMWSGDSKMKIVTKEKKNVYEVKFTQADVGPIFKVDTTGKDMSKYDYIQFYIKGPGSNATDGSRNLSLNVSIRTQDDENSPIVAWFMANEGDIKGKYYFKDDKDEEWTIRNDLQNLWLDKNFSGYIRVPLNRFVLKENLPSPDSKLDRNKITEIALWMNVGETLSDVIYISDFTVQNEPEPIIPQGNSLMSFKPLQPLSEYAYMLWSGDCKVSLTKRNGINSFKVDITQNDVGPIFKLNTNGKDLSRTNYIEFHVVGPGTRANDNTSNFMLSVQLFTKANEDAETVTWSMANADEVWDGLNRVPNQYYFKSDTDTEWSTYGEGDYGIWIHKNFSGYIRVPIGRFTVRNVGDKPREYVGNRALNVNEITEMAVWMSVGDTTNKYMYFDDFKVDKYKQVKGVSGTNSIPQTGDSSNPLMAYITAFISLICVAFCQLSINRIRRERRQS